MLKLLVIRRRVDRPRKGLSFLRPAWAFCAFCFAMGALHALGVDDAGAALIAAGLAMICLWLAAAY